MNKIGLLILFFLAFVFPSFNQIQTVKIGSGSKTKEIQFEDDPSVIPAWEINIQPITFGISPKLYSALHLEPKYKLGDQFSISMPLTIPYTKNSYRGSRPDIPITRTQTIDLRFLGHYNLTSKEMVKKESITVNKYIEWKDMPRKRLTNYFVDFGIGYFSSGSIYDKIHNEQGVFTIRYWQGGKISSFGAILGISAEKTKSTKITIDSLTFSQFRINRFYSNLSLGFINNFEVYDISFDPLIVNPEDQYLPITTVSDEKALDLLTFIPIGWRIGYSYNKSIKSSPHSFSIGIEVGQTQGFKQKGLHSFGWLKHFNRGTYSNPFHFKLRIGIAFGKKTVYSSK